MAKPILKSMPSLSISECFKIYFMNNFLIIINFTLKIEDISFTFILPKMIYWIHDWAYLNIPPHRVTLQCHSAFITIFLYIILHLPSMLHLCSRCLCYHVSIMFLWTYAGFFINICSYVVENVLAPYNFLPF